MESLEKKYYRIKDVSELLGIPESTLRFWEKKFKVIHPKRNNRGVRFYTASDMKVISMVNYLVKDRGHKLEVAEEIIRNNPSGISRRHAAIERLKSVRAQLVELRDALDSLR